MNKTDTQTLEQAQGKIKTEREKVENVVRSVETLAEKGMVEKFPATLADAERKANEAKSSIGPLSGAVKDEKTILAVNDIVAALLDDCGKWKKSVPTGKDGVQAYTSIMQSLGDLDVALARTHESHTQWEEEEN